MRLALAALVCLVLASAASAQPVAAGFAAKQVPGKNYQLTGTVTGGTGVKVTGAATALVLAGPGGVVNWTFAVPAPGPVAVTPGDGTTWGAAVPVALTNAPPGVTVTAVTAYGDGVYIVSGTATDDTTRGAAGLTVGVTDGGVGLGAGQVAADGTWSAVVRGAPGRRLAATVIDWFGVAATAPALLP